ncbi:hypothetical protein K8I61_07830 [bacterium]|nr:hypothetical protein [bacterium]
MDDRDSIFAFFFTLACVLMTATALFGCGGDDDDDDDDDATDDDMSDDDATDDDASDDDTDDDTADDDADDDTGDDDDDADDDTGDDDTSGTFSWDEADCFEANGIRDDTSICQFYATDLVGRDAEDPAEEFKTYLFPDGFTYVEYDRWNAVIEGTDLGVNVKVGDKTYYFFGDTHPVMESKTETGPVVGVPWGVDTDGDLQIDNIAGNSEGNAHYFSITDFAAFDGDGDPTPLLNQHEREYIYPGGQPSGTEVSFFVPTGAAQVDEETIYYWYGKYISNTNCDQTHLLAFDLDTETWRYVSGFATQKFIQVAPILVNRNEIDDPDTCPLPWTEPHERGFLIYGSGRPVHNGTAYGDATPTGACRLGSFPNYRSSDLYLGYVKLGDMEDPQVNTKVYSYSGPDNGCWTQGNYDAAIPLIGKTEFGEFSAVRIPGTSRLLLAHSFVDDESKEWMESHPEYGNDFVGELELHAADISRPWAFTQPKGAAAFGYGNYIVESSMQVIPQFEVNGEVVDDNVLAFARVVSTWKGMSDPNFTEYGASVVWSVTDLDDFESELDAMN